MKFADLLRRSVNLVPWSWRGRIRNIPGVARLQRWLLARYVGTTPFLHTINSGPAKGLRVIVSLPADKGVWTGTYECTFVSAVAAAVKPHSICFDIGGYHGFVSGTMGLAGATRVICFEPLPANLAAIRKLMSINPTLPIEVRDEAVGASDDTMQFAVFADESMGKLARTRFQPDQIENGTIDVAVRALDSLLASAVIPVPDLIKIDVEGAELDVLNGARNLLATHHPEIFLEAHSPELRADCERLLQQMGYGTRPLSGSGASEGGSIEVSHLHCFAKPT